MALFFWQKYKAIDRFAMRYADEFYSDLNPEIARDYFLGKTKDKKEIKKSGKKIDSLINGVAHQIGKYIETEKLGLFGKARLYIQFQKRLKELGYDEKLITKINEQLMIKASK